MAKKFWTTLMVAFGQAPEEEEQVEEAVVKTYRLSSGYGKWDHIGGWQPCPVCGDPAGRKLRHKASGAVMCACCKMVRDNLSGDLPIGHPKKGKITWADYHGTQGSIGPFDPTAPGVEEVFS